VNRQDEQYRRATESAGLIALDDWSTVRATGGDRATFLHNMCTNDIRDLAAGAGCEAFFTDVKGKIVAHAFVLADEDAIQLLAIPGTAQRLIAHLDRYIIREDVQLADASADFVWTLLVGAKAGDALARSHAATPDFVVPWSHARVTITGETETEVQVVRCPLPWCGGFLLGCPSHRAGILRDALVDDGLTTVDGDVWHAIRIESAWPLWGVDFDDSNLPQEVNRNAMAINFRKGCYLGQETVARIDALGHVNKKLVQVRFSDQGVPPVVAELLQGGNAAGRVTSACWSPKLNAPLALAMVRRGANEPSASLRWGNATAEVLNATR
jgi:folate-binding protein YgfZ